MAIKLNLNPNTMTKSFLISLVVSFTSLGFGYAQSSERLYRTEEGSIYTQAQLDSIGQLGFPIGKVGEKEINGTTFMMVQIYASIDEINHLTSKYKGKPLPDITLETMDGKTITSKDLKGKIVMINFWSTTCGPCIIEMPELNRLQEDYKDKVVFLAPLPENTSKATKLIAKHPFQFIIAPNSSDLFEQLGIDGYPKNFFVDREGIIQEVKEGTPQQRDTLDGEWYVSVYKEYSAILDKILNSH